MGIYIKIILFNYIINSVDLESSDSEKNIFKIRSGDTIASAPKIKYCRGIKENNIKIYILSSI